MPKSKLSNKIQDEKPKLNTPKMVVDSEDQESKNPHFGPSIATSLNTELEEKVKENPNRFIGCGG